MHIYNTECLFSPFSKIICNLQFSVILANFHRILLRISMPQCWVMGHHVVKIPIQCNYKVHEQMEKYIKLTFAVTWYVLTRKCEFAWPSSKSIT